MARMIVNVAFPCRTCGCDEGIFDYDTTLLRDQVMLSCVDCGTIFYHGDDKEEAATHLATFNPFEEQRANEVPTQVPMSFTMKEAYEANKTRQVCIACGSKLGKNYALTPAISYCACVEKLPVK